MSQSKITDSVLSSSVSGGVDNAERRRAYAVAAALEVIAAKASGADATSLKVEFLHLSTYADQIQAALAKQ